MRQYNIKRLEDNGFVFIKETKTGFIFEDVAFNEQIANYYTVSRGNRLSQTNRLRVRYSYQEKGWVNRYRKAILDSGFSHYFQGYSLNVQRKGEIWHDMQDEDQATSTIIRAGLIYRRRCLGKLKENLEKVIQL